VLIEIADGHGTPIRTITATGRAGLNRASWDMRIEPPIVPDMSESGAVSPAVGAPPGPLVLPGNYSVSIAAGARRLTGTVSIEADPRVTFPDADRRARQAALLDLYGLVKALGGARLAAAAAVTRAEAVNRAAPGDRQDPAASARSLQTQLAALINSASSLSRAIEGYSGAPTADQRRQIQWAFDDAARAIETLNKARRSDDSQVEPLAIPRRQ
jgi:hypothetical protein